MPVSTVADGPARRAASRWTLTAINCVGKVVERTSTVACIVNLVRPTTAEPQVPTGDGQRA